MTSLPRLLRTVRPLRASQITWRLGLGLTRRLEEAGLGLHPVRAAALLPSAIRQDFPELGDLFPWPGATTRRQECDLGHLTLLHQTLPFAGGSDWRMTGPRREHRLWAYHLHYHQWLVELAREGRQGDARAATCLLRFLRDWLDVCRPGRPGFWHFPWNSFAIATRLVSWSFLIRDAPPGLWREDPTIARDIEQSLAMQAEYLSRHVEWDLRGNHLFRDAVGLAVAARLLDHPHAPQWLELAWALTRSQIREQVLSDGGHFERSPSYHIQVMGDMSLLRRLLEGRYPTGDLQAVLSRMADFMTWVRHPDGGVPLVNDATLHTEYDPEALLREARPSATPPAGARFFADAGLMVVHEPGWSLFFDCGEVGPACQAGHAHADSLTVDLSFRGARLVVDPGTYSYDRDARRSYDRSTAAHNTVEIDGQDSSEVWDIFRTGRRASCTRMLMERRPEGLQLSASHDGYRHLPGSPRHRRTISLDHDGSLTIVDRVTGDGEHEVSGGWLFEPSWEVHERDGAFTATRQGTAVRVRITGPAGLAVQTVSRPYHPDFGVELDVTRLMWRIRTVPPVEVRTTFEPGV